MISQPGTRRSFLALITISFLVISCRQVDVYEKNIPIPHYKWQHNFTVSGSFIISDTGSLYNIYIVLRHTDAYQYNNIWLNAGLQGPGDSMLFQKVNLTLATDATGWEGTGMNDIWEVRKLLNAEPRKFKKKGEYKFTISHIMRDDPLQDIMSAGMRVQKAD
ncbi:MAG: gliding motility lipoprotein GldH [Ferruginibacter sp.]